MDMVKYDDFAKRFSKMTDGELISALQLDNVKPGWTSSRDMFLGALKEEFKQRGLLYPPNQ